MPGQTRLSLIRTCDDVSIAILHPVLIFLGRVPWCRLSLKEALRKGGGRQKQKERDETGTRREGVYEKSCVSSLQSHKCRTGSVSIIKEAQGKEK